MESFWQQNTHPFFILAPMEDVTDTVFREVVMSVSNPEVLNVLFTEFTSTDGLMDERGFEKVSARLKINTSELKTIKERGTKLVAQIWGNEPNNFFRTAKLLTEWGNFDGIDINMGCPVKKVVKKGTCSALIKTPDLAAEIIQATKEGTSLPVSVKTRIGFNTVVTEGWLGHLLQQDIAALIVHGRTQKMQSEGLADWSEIGKAVSLKKNFSKTTAIIGNGDVESYAQGMQHIQTHSLDGVMVGRGIFKNPWMFNKEEVIPTIDQRLMLLHKHLNLFTDTWGKAKNFNILKRFFKIYINSFKGAGAVRAELMESKNADEAHKVLEGAKILI
jgi:tRNA-dihydrouridine synthase